MSDKEGQQPARGETGNGNTIIQGETTTPKKQDEIDDKMKRRSGESIEDYVKRMNEENG